MAYKNLGKGHHVVMKAEFFKGLIREIRERCDVPAELSASARNMKIGNHMVNQMSYLSTYTMSPPIYKKMGDDIELSHDVLAAMPCYGFPFSVEAYESGCREYFGMYEVDGVLGHVKHGVYVEPSESESAKSYDFAMAWIKQNKPWLFSDDVKAAYPDLFPEKEDSESESEEEEEPIAVAKGNRSSVQSNNKKLRTA